MSFTIIDKYTTDVVTRNANEAARAHSDSLEKLSSGSVFTKEDPRPAERALAEKMEFKLRGLAAAKKNINDAVSLLQTAESGFSEINNILTRMKEINFSAASTTVTAQERKYLMIEYGALFNEIDRIAKTTEYNGVPLLNGKNSGAPDELLFRVGDPAFEEKGGGGGGGSGGDSDLNLIRLSNLKAYSATTVDLGLKSASDLLDKIDSGDPIELDDAIELMEPEDSDNFTNVYDEALDKLSQHRAVFGAFQGRLQKSFDYVDVYQENIAAAKSKIADTNYSEEVSRMLESRIRLQAATSILAQSNFAAGATLNLLNAVLR